MNYNNDKKEIVQDFFGSVQTILTLHNLLIQEIMNLKTLNPKQKAIFTDYLSSTKFLLQVLAQEFLKNNQYFLNK